MFRMVRDEIRERLIPELMSRCLSAACAPCR